MNISALTLCGFGVSNYYNKVKFVLLEKGIAFEESTVYVGDTDPACSPLGKVPYLLTPQGPLSESAVIVEYLEQLQPQPALLPAEPYAVAKVREISTYIELHLELEARKLYPQAFFGGKVSQEVSDRTAKVLRKHIAAFTALAKFSPYVAGDTFTLADCAAAVHLPVISMATRQMYGEDFLQHLPIKSYLANLSERPAMQRVNADRKAANQAFADRMAAAVRTSTP